VRAVDLPQNVRAIGLRLQPVTPLPVGVLDSDDEAVVEPEPRDHLARGERLAGTRLTRQHERFRRLVHDALDDLLLRAAGGQLLLHATTTAHASTTVAPKHTAAVTFAIMNAGSFL